MAALGLLALLVWAPGAAGETASSQLRASQAGLLDAGGDHSCAVLADGTVRCWGSGAFGQLGYGNTANIGDDETPASAGPVDLGAGRTARAVAVGADHSCALLDNGAVRCWGRNDYGQLGYGNTTDIGDDETPGSVGTVDLGPGRAAAAITAGSGFTCALLDTGTVRCWGNGAFGELGYGSTANIGDDETPGSVEVVNLPAPARAISAGGYGNTCAILDTGEVYCWGNGALGALGYGDTQNIGDDEDPRSAGPVQLGAGRTAKTIAVGGAFACVIMDNDAVRCWGYGQFGRNGLGNTQTVGNSPSTLPDSVPPVQLGAGRTAVALSAGGGLGSQLAHACAILDDGGVRCWGHGPNGELGYGNTDDIGDDETPDTAGPVSLGAGRTARAVTAGITSSCVLLDDGTVRCWGAGTAGQLGLGSVANVGDAATPETVPAPVLGGVLVGASGDASVTLRADRSAVPVGSFVRLTAALSSAGLDPLTGGVVTVTLPPGLQQTAAAASAGTFTAGAWAVPPLTAGMTATLTVVARARVPGALTATAELTAASPVFRDIDSTPGNHLAGEDDQASVTVGATLTSAAGSTATAPNRAPVLSGLSMSRRTFLITRKATAVNSAKRVGRGTAFRFRLSERATVTIRLERARGGRRVGRRCAAPTRKNRGRKRCTRYTRAGTLTRRNLAAGRRSVAFSGRIGRRALGRGSYRATLTPRDSAGKTGKSRRITFTVR